MIIEIKKISIEEVKELSNDKEFLVIQGCGGDLNEWSDGIADMFTDAGIVPKGFKFKEVYSFKNDKINNMLFSLDDKDINIGKLTIFRLQIREEFGAMWLSDYVNNYLKVDEHIDI
jgi:hypothetical protein